MLCVTACEYPAVVSGELLPEKHVLFTQHTWPYGRRSTWLRGSQIHTLLSRSLMPERGEGEAGALCWELGRLEQAASV